MQGIEVLFMGNNMLRLWGGLWVTLRLSLISIALSLVIGVFVGALMLVDPLSNFLFVLFA